MNKNKLLVSLFIVLLFQTFLLPARSNQEIINQLITDTKLPANGSYTYIRERGRKGDKKGGLGTDSITCPQCPAQNCPSSSPDQQCLQPNSLINLVASRYTFSIPIVVNQLEQFQLNITNILPSGVFNYTAINLTSGNTQQNSVGLIAYDTIHFTVAALNLVNLSGTSLIHTLDCTGFLQPNKTVSGVCSTIGGDNFSTDLVYIAQPFTAIPN